MICFILAAVAGFFVLGTGLAIVAIIGILFLDLISKTPFGLALWIFFFFAVLIPLMGATALLAIITYNAIMGT